MKIIGTLAAALALLPLVGCGGGGGKVGSIVGAWRNVALGAADGSGLAAVNCPGTLTVDGEDITCYADDATYFGADNTYMDDSRDEFGRRQRIRGVFAQTGNDFKFTISQFSVDVDGSGTFSADETEELAAVIVFDGRLTKLEDGALGLVYEFDGYSYAVAFERLSV